jgi:hypothetical protein
MATGGPHQRNAALTLKRVALVALMVIVSVNVWTGSPLLGLWVGSRFQGSGPPSMGAIAVVAVVIGVCGVVLVRVLAALERLYDRVLGRRRQISRHTPWLRSMRGERPHEAGDELRWTPLEVVLVISVVVAVSAFEIWFFFFSSSPIDGRSGRH